MEFIVEDCNSNSYKVIAEERENGNIFCEVYRALGIGGNEYDYSEMEYEEDPSAEFLLNSEDYENVPTSDDEIELEEYVQDLFYDNAWLSDELGYEVMDTEEEVWEAPHAKKVLAEFYNKEWAKGSDCDVIENLLNIANKMAEIIESKFDEVQLH